MNTMNRTYYYVVPFLMILTIAVVEMATAIYTPSLPAVAQHFQISEAIVQWTVSINLFGLALSGPIYGPWSDCYGRRIVLRVGMGLFLLGSLFSWVAQSIEMFLVMRFLQGLGAGVAVVVAFAVVRDLFDEKKSAQILSYMGMAIALSPGFAPVVGSYIAHHFGWKSCFGVVSVTAFSIVLMLFFWMPETLPDHNRSHFSLKNITLGYLKAFKNGKFLFLALIPGLMIGGIWAWMAALPVLFITYLDVPMQYYGYYGFSGVVFYVIGAYINSKVIHRYSLNALLLWGLGLCFLSALLLVVAGVSKVDHALILQILEFPFAFGLAFILPNGTALAFSEVREGLGTSSALLGSLEMALGALGVFLVGKLFNGTIIPIASIMLVGTCVSFCLYAGLYRVKQ
jgi:DHA1 family bicyclomycin/chloramphenicol resistance-like MFS transporter